MARGFGGNRSGSGKNHGRAYGSLDKPQTMSRPDPGRYLKENAKQRELRLQRKFEVEHNRWEKRRQEFEDGLERALRKALADEP